MNMKVTDQLRRLEIFARWGMWLVAVLAACAFFTGAANGQESQGPRTPPPPEHDVKRVTSTEATAEAPPSMPQPLIVKHFAEKEEEYAKARIHYGYKKTVKLTEYGANGNPMGEFAVTSTPIVASDGRLYERVSADEVSTLKTVRLSPEDLNAIAKIPAYPLACRTSKNTT